MAFKQGFLKLLFVKSCADAGHFLRGMKIKMHLTESHTAFLLVRDVSIIYDFCALRKSKEKYFCPRLRALPLKIKYGIIILIRF